MFKKLAIRLLMFFFDLFPLKNQVLFISFDGRQYSCNPKYISMKLNEINPTVKQYWAFNSFDVKFPKYVTLVKKKTIKYLYVLATSKVWVTNCSIQNYHRKRKKQVYIQTWHGDGGFKRLIGDEMCSRVEEKMLGFDIGLCGCKHAEEYVYNKAFHYNGKLLKYGTPRNDILLNYNLEINNQIRKKLNIKLDAFIIIYAPTFRDSLNSKFDQIPFDVNKLIFQMSKIMNKECIFIYRGHFVTNQKGNFTVIESKNFIDFSAYPDINDLMIISDIMISDYSSCVCDFILQKKPAILYHFDYKDYSDNNRELIYKDEELPFKIAYNESELFNKLCEVLNSDIQCYCKNILDFYGSYESGNASFKCSQEIINIIEKR